MINKPSVNTASAVSTPGIAPAFPKHPPSEIIPPQLPLQKNDVPQPVNPFASILPADAPPEMHKLIALLATPDISLSEIDEQMGWPLGETRSKLKRWPILAKTATEARMLAMRAAGLEKTDAYKVYKEALDAEKTVSVEDNTNDVEPGSRTNVTEPDHKIRITAADRVLTLFGESPVTPRPQSAPTYQQNNITVNSSDVTLLTEIMGRMERLQERMNNDGAIDVGSS